MRERMTHTAIKPWSKHCLRRACLIAVLAVFLCTWHNEARAQVNIDTLRPGPARAGLSGGLEGSVMNLDGNVQLFDVGVGGRVQVTQFAPLSPGDNPKQRKIKQMAILVSNFRYTARGTPAGTLTIVNQALLHARLMHLWHPRIGSIVFAQHQTNEFQRMNVRSVWGTSLVSPILQRPSFSAQIGSGYMFEYNRLSILPGTSDPNQTYEHRWWNMFGLRANFFNGRLLTQNTIMVQPRWDKLSDFRFLEELELLVKVNDVIGLGGTASYLYDSAPPTRVKNTDTRISSNIKLAF